MCAAAARAESAPIPHGTLELVPENPWIAAQSILTPGVATGRMAGGHTFNVGLRFQLEKGWHIYWINPGDSGEPARVEWKLPAGLTAGPIEWPTPRRLASGSIVDYGYEGAVLLIVPLHADASLASQSAARLGAEIRLLVCSHEMCIPAKAALSLTVPVKAQAPVPDATTVAWFAAARKSMPRPPSQNWRFNATEDEDFFVLTAELGHPITQTVFFPLVESQIENAAPQTLVPRASGFRLTLRKSNQLLASVARLKGVLVVSGDRTPGDGTNQDRAYVIDVPVRKAGATKHLEDGDRSVK